MKYSDPAVWDDLWEHQQPQHLLALLSKNKEANPDWHARYVQTLGMLGQLAEALDHTDSSLAMYEGQPGCDVDLLRAVRLQLLNACGQYAQVVHDAREVFGIAPRRMEAACITQSALAYAQMYLGDKTTAMLHLGQALGLANALDLPHRRRAIQLSWSHLLNSMGLPAPRDVLLGITKSPHRATARTGAIRVVESYMYAGDYPLAEAIAIKHELPDMARLARAFMGQWDDDPGDDVVLGIKMIYSRRYSEIPAINVDTTALSGYGRILNAARSLDAGTRSNFRMVLGDEPGHPDQRFYWHAIKLIAIVEGLLDDNLAEAITHATEALLAVPNQTYLTKMLSAGTPRIAVLLAHAPDSRLSSFSTGVAVPFLADNYLINHNRIPVTDVVAKHLIAQSLGMSWVINTGYLSKYRSRLREAGIDPASVVTIGELYRYAEMARNTASGRLAEAWDGVLERLRRSSPLLRQVLESRL